MGDVFARLGRLRAPAATHEFSEYLSRSLDQSVCREPAGMRSSRRQAALIELLDRLEHDWRPLIDRFGLDPSSRLATISVPLGDVHNGRTVHGLRFSDGQAIVYKPRPVEAEHALRRLVDWFARTGCPMTLRAALVLPGAGYGWMEYVPPHPCSTPDEISTFYRRQGAWLACFWLLCADDLNAENVIVSGDHPVWVDTECTGVPEVSFVRDQSARMQESFKDSVISTGMVFYGTPSARSMPSRTGLHLCCARDRSAVFASDGSMHPPFRQAVVTGFQEMYAWILKMPAQAIEREILGSFAGGHVRVMLRETAFYGELLGRLTSTPESLRAGVEAAIAETFERTRPSAAPWPADLLRAEMAALRRGDIPYWYTQTDSYEVREAGDPTPIQGLVTRTGMDRAKRRAARMCTDDMVQQSWLIDSFLGRATSRYARIEVSAMAGEDGMTPGLARECAASSGWRPLLHGSDRRRALDILSGVSSALASATNADACLSTGVGALPLYLAYASSLDANERGRARAIEIIHQSAAQLETSRHPCSFAYGATGLGWVQGHLHTQFGWASAVDLRGSITERVSRQLSDPSLRPVYESSHGLVGYGIYAAECLDGAEEHRLLQQVVSRLAATALPSSRGGVCWWTAPQNLSAPQRAACPFGCFDLGLAHGIPSIIGLLGRACEVGVAEDLARTLFSKAVTWLRTQRQSDDAGSCFGTIVPVGGRRAKSETSRLAWCFGDLGLSAAVYAAARAFGDESLAAEMLDVARRAARRDPGISRVADAGVCHGSTGNAHIFNRFHQATGEQVFGDAAHYWMTRTFAYFDAHLNRGRAAGSSYNGETGNDEAVWSDAPGLFGLTGIALILLASVTGTEPLWDRALLVSMPVANPAIRGR